MYLKMNVNPECRKGDDCTVRALSVIEGKSWEDMYLDLCIYGLKLHDMPSANHVWGAYLIDKGYTRHICPNNQQTVSEFARGHKKGHYILALHGHVVAVVDGCYIDSWDSGNEIPVYYWQKEGDNVRI